MKNKLYYTIVSVINLLYSWKISKTITNFFSKNTNGRKTLTLDQTLELSKNISLGRYILSTPELHKSNDWYGHAVTLKKYCGLNKDFKIKGVIEHGSFFGNYIWNQDLDSKLPLVITMNPNRIELLEKKMNKKAFAIGPYIHYAKQYYTPEKIRKERQRLGYNLLVFPTHSTSVSLASYDIKKFIKKINYIGKSFDSIRICLYWKDILRGFDKIYSKEGFECVSAGHIFDPLFLSRLKTIITTSTQTMTNAVSTYSGYCLYLKKPHYFYPQVFVNIGEYKELRYYKNKKESEALIELQNALKTFTHNISKKQLKIAGNFWGFKEIKTPKELKKILTGAPKLS